MVNMNIQLAILDENLSAPVEHPTCEEVADWKLNAFSMGLDFGIPEHQGRKEESAGMTACLHAGIDLC